MPGSGIPDLAHPKVSVRQSSIRGQFLPWKSKSYLISEVETDWAGAQFIHNREVNNELPL